MTDRLRPTASTITDTQLDRLHDRLHTKDRFIRRLYDAWRSARRRARQRTAERDQHAALLRDILNAPDAPTHCHTHPAVWDGGGPCAYCTALAAAQAGTEGSTR